MRWKTIILTAGLFLSLCGAVNAQSILNVTLLGHHGSPMEQAHVALMGGPDLKLIVQTGEDGRYSIELPGPGGYRLYAMGVHHETLRIPLIVEGTGPVDLSVRLAPKFLSHDLDSVWVAATCPSGTFRQLMVIRSDGTYSARVSTTSDSLVFQVSATTRGGDTIVLAGTEHDKLFLDEVGPFWDTESDYSSVVESSAGTAVISFDPFRLPEQAMRAVIERDPSIYSELHAADLFVNEQSRLELDAFWAQKRGEITQQQYDSRLDDLQTPVRERIDGLEDGLLRQWLLLSYFHVLMPAAKDSLLARQVLKNVAPGSVLWSYFAQRPLDVTLLIQTVDYRSNEPDETSSYLSRAIESHTDSEVRSQFLLAAVMLAHDAGDESLKWQYYLQLQGDYAESPQAEHARQHFSPERALQPGNAIPSFSFAALGDERQAYTDKLLRGSVYLLDFWGTWCAGSYAQLPDLHETYKKYRDAGFEILSIAMLDSRENVVDFRKEHFPMPWLHALVTSEDHEAIVETFEVSAFPWPILVDREGTIITLGRDFRARDLSELLDEVMGANE